MRKRQRTITVFPNPYAHIDANGRLAGATPVGELPRKTSIAPTRSFVGATRQTIETDSADRGPQFTQQSRSEYQFVWGTEPVVVDASDSLGAYYQQLAAAGDIFILPEGRPEVPLAKLAAARSAAFEQYRAEQSHNAECAKLTDSKASCDCISDPDASEWAKQFPLDLDVAAAAKLLADKAAKDAETAKAEQEKAAKDAASKAKAEADKAAADAKKAADEANAEAEKRARLALGIEAGPKPPPKPGSGKAGANTDPNTES